MPNVVDSTGIQIQSVDEIIANILFGTADYQGMYAIYGPNINVNPNSPDGQMINIIAQAKRDILELALQIATSFDPDQAVGIQLDERCAINGVIRQAGSYTLQQVEITVTGSVTLLGLDSNPLTGAFVVQDSSGNRYSPLSTTNISGAGTTAVIFRALVLGNVESAPNTITTIVTVQAGVTGANNPSGPTSVGLIEETDSKLRIRRQNSVALPSQGFLQGLVGALLNTEGVLEALVLENVTDTTDSNGIPSHSIWVIVEGGSNDDVAHAIYLKRNAGCGMKGSVVVAVPQVDGTTFDIKFDRPTTEPLYLSFDIAAITGAIDVDYIKAQILENITYSINQIADTTSIVAFINSIAPNASVSNEGVSLDNMVYTPTVAPTNVNNQLILSDATIIINGTS